MTAFEDYKKKKEEEQMKQTLLSDNANIIKLLEDLNSKEWKPEVNIETPKAEVDVNIPKIEVPKAEVDVNIPEIKVPTPEVTVVNDNKKVIEAFKKLPLSDIQKILKDIKTDSKKGDVALLKSIRELEKAIKKISISFSTSGGGTNNDILQQIADNTGTLELKADQINLNTDEIEAKLDTLETDKALASKQLPNNHDVNVSNQITGFATEDKQDEIIDAINNQGAFDTLETTATTLTTADTAYLLPTTPQVGRRAIILYNVSDTDIFYGDNSVTTTNGILLASGAEVSLDISSGLYAVCGTDGKIINTLELK